MTALVLQNMDMREMLQLKTDIGALPVPAPTLGIISVSRGIVATLIIAPFGMWME